MISALQREVVRNADAGASRELRNWLEQYPPDDDKLDLGALDRKVRANLMALLLPIAEQELEPEEIPELIRSGLEQRRIDQEDETSTDASPEEGVKS